MKPCSFCRWRPIAKGTNGKACEWRCTDCGVTCKLDDLKIGGGDGVKAGSWTKSGRDNALQNKPHKHARDAGPAGFDLCDLPEF